MHVTIAAVPAFAALALRWRRSGPGAISEEASRICLLVIAVGLLASNAQVARWPVLLVHVAITVWIAWNRGPGGAGISHWVLAWVFYSSPLFPHKVAAPLWLGALVAWLWWHVAAEGMVPPGRGQLAGGLVPAWLALTCVWVASTAASPCPGPALEMLRMWTPSIVALPPLLWAAGRGQKSVVEIAAPWAVGSAAVGLVVTAGRVFDTGLGHWGPRTAPAHLHPNAMAFWLVIGLTAAVAWWSRGGRAAVFLALPSIIGIIATGSKAGVAAVFICFAVWAVAAGPRRVRFVLPAVVIVVGVVALIIRAAPISGSSSDRMALLRAGLLCFLDRPLLGWGMGLHHLHLRFGWQSIWQAGVLDWHTHNLAVETAQGAGTLGLVALLALFVLGTRAGKGLFRLPLAMVLVLGMVDYVLHVRGEMATVVLALSLCAPRHEPGVRRVAMAAVGLVLSLTVVPMIPTVAERCSLDPAEQLTEARHLWDTGLTDASLQAYRTTAMADPGEVRAQGVWEEGGLRSLDAGRREQGLTMLSRAVLANPDIAGRGYWHEPSLGQGTAAAPGLPEVFGRAEEEARWARARNEAGGVMLMWNLTRGYHVSGRIEDASRVFDEIADTPQMRRRMGDAELWDEQGWAESSLYEGLRQTRLTEGYFKAAFTHHDMPASVAAGRPVRVHVVVQNIGTGLWLAGGATRLGYDWFRSDGTQLTELAGRELLPQDVPSGESVEFDLWIPVPRTSGSYRLVMDMLVEQVAWFAARGSRKLEIAVEVR